MDISKISTVDDFERLSFQDKAEFKMGFPSQYRTIFGLPAKEELNYRAHKQDLSFFPSDVKTPDDFERLPDAGKMYLKMEFPEQYKRIFSRT